MYKFPSSWTFGYEYDRDAKLYEIFDIETGAFDHYEPTEYDAIDFCENYTHSDDFPDDIEDEYKDKAQMKESLENYQDIPRIADEIVNNLSREVNVDLYSYDKNKKTISFEINGDWKHSHLWFDDLMREQYPEFKHVRTYSLDDTKEDWYDGVHVYKLSEHADDLRRLKNFSSGLTEKLLDVPSDVIRHTKSLATSYNLEVAREGKLMFGGYHMEFAPIGEVDFRDMVQFARRVSKYNDALGCPTTFNVTPVLAVIDIREQSVDDNGNPIPFANDDDIDEPLVEKKKKLKRKSLGAWLIPNAGNVEYNIAFFNHMMGADKDNSTNKETTSTDGAVADNSSGDVGGATTAMAESLDKDKFKLVLSKKPTETFMNVKIPFDIRASIQGEDDFSVVYASSDVTEDLPADVEFCPSDEDWISFFTQGLEISNEELLSMSETQLDKLIAKDKSYMRDFLEDVMKDGLSNLSHLDPTEDLFNVDPFGDGTKLSIHITNATDGALQDILQSERERINDEVPMKKFRKFYAYEHLNRAKNRKTNVYHRRRTFESVDKKDFKLGAFAQWFEPFDKDVLPQEDVADYNKQQDDVEEVVKANYGSFTQYMGCAIAKPEFYEDLKVAGYNILDFIDSPKGILAIKVVDNKCVEIKVDSIINALDETER